MTRLRDPWSGEVVEVGEGVSEAKRLKILLDGGFEVLPEAVAQPTGAVQAEKRADSSPPEAEAPVVVATSAGVPHPSKTAKKVKK